MIRLGLRLTLKGGREAGARLIVTALAVALGTAMLLLTLGGVNGVNTQNARYAWLETGYVPGDVSSRPVAGVDPAWWELRGDYFHGEIMGRADVAVTGTRSPVPPGIPRLPGPGEFFASPALSALLRTTPAAELAARFGGHQVGTIGAAGLPAPDMLIVVVGHTVADLSRREGALRIYSINTLAPNECGDCAVGVGINANGIDLILAVVAMALLFPVLMFIGSASRLSAARREQRFAAMRLAGATPRQIAVIATVESSVAAVLGMLAGFALFFCVRAPFATIPLTGQPFYSSDVSLSRADVIAVALGVPLASALVARLALRRLQVSPLEVSRASSARVASPYRLIPLVVGLAELTFWVRHGRPATSVHQIEAYLGGMLTVMVGLVLAGPWVTMTCARLLARRTGRPTALLAGRRLADNPQAAFRAIAGLVLALFVTSAAVGTIDAVVAHGETHRGGGTAATSMLILDFPNTFTSDPTPGPPIAADLLSTVRGAPGVNGVAVVYANPAAPHGEHDATPTVIRCSQLASTPYLGRCQPGATTAAVTGNLYDADYPSGTVWPASNIPLAGLQALPVQTVVVATDGSTAAVERARTVLESAFWPDRMPTTLGEDDANNARDTRQYERLADVVILTSLPVAGASLAVTLVAGLSERRRPFSLLRLTGVPLGVLRRVVAAETAVPLLAGAGVAIGMGFLCAQLFLVSQLHYGVRPPGLGYYAVVVAGLAASLGVLASTFPLLTRMTGPEAARND
jgi:hypothetical protein